MAGSNRTPASPNGHNPPHWGTPEAEAHGQAPVHPQTHGHPPGDALSRWTPPQQAYAQQPPQYQPQAGYPQPPQAYAPPQAYGHPGQPAAQPPAQYGYPQQQPDPYTQPPTQPPHPGYAGEAQQRQAHDRYTQPPVAAPHLQPLQYDAHQQHADPHALSYPADAQRGYPPSPYSPQGYPAPQAQAPAYALPTAEQQNWDLQHYAPGQAQQPQQAHGIQPGFDAALQARPDAFGSAHGHGHDPRYTQPPQHQQPQHQQPGHWPGQPNAAHSGDPAFELDRYAQPAQQGYAPQYQGAPGHGQQAYAQQGYEQPADPNQQADQDFGYEDEPVEEKRRGPRAMVVVGALVGAIVVGGGLAMGYQMFSGSAGKSDSKATPVVKAAATPVKTKPSDAGGKEMADQDKKFANRLGAGGGSATTTSEQAQVAGASAAADPDAPRKVQTVVVNRDGTITPAAGLPGMVVDGGPQLRGPAPQAGEPVTTPVARQTPVAPAVANLPLPKVKPDGLKKDANGDIAPATPPTPKKKVAVRDDMAAPKAESGSTGSAGFVAALTSKKSRVDALGAFATLQQNYADLQGKVPDVKEVEIPEKGTWYRLVVGPPGSKESVAELCKKLKAQGLKDCWVSAY